MQITFTADEVRDFIREGASQLGFQPETIVIHERGAATVTVTNDAAQEEAVEEDE